MFLTNMDIKIRKFPLKYYCNLILRPCLSFSSCSNNVLYRKGSSSQLLIQFPSVPQSFLCFMALTLLKIRVQLFCRMSLSLCFSAISSRLGLGHASLIGMSQKHQSFPLCILSSDAWFWFIFFHSILSDTIQFQFDPLFHFRHLIKGVSTRVSYYEVTFFPLYNE